MKRWLLLVLLAVAATCHAEIAPWQDNPRYWSLHGQPVLLVGGSDDDNLFQWPAGELIQHLDKLKAAGGNLVRNTMSDRRDKGFEVYPYRQLPSGRYDLDQWNPEYWQRFERLLAETAKRDIVVQIELWDRFDFADHSTIKYWQASPYNPRNNVNYTYWQSGFVSRYPDHPGQNTQPFFFTTPEQRNNRLLLGYQQRYIDKVMEHALRYDHVLYCIDNETKAGEAWSRYWTEYIKAKARRQHKTIYVTEMLDDRAMDPDKHGRTLNHPELYDFIEVSQNNHNRGAAHWDNLLRVRGYLDTHPRPMNSIKVYGADGNAFGHSDQDGIERFWRSLLGGIAAVRFHRPPGGLGLNDKAIAALRAARMLESVVSVWQLRPVPGRQAQRYYQAEGERRSQVWYFPRGVPPAVSDMPAGHRIKWLNLDRAEWQREPRGEPFSPSEAGNWIAIALPEA